MSATTAVTASRVILPNPAVSESVADHRTDYWTWVEEHAEPWIRAWLLDLRDEWRHNNAEFFGGRMLEPYITLTAPSAPQLYGQCWSVSSWGSRLEIKLRPSLLAGTHPKLRFNDEATRLRFVQDVLLHEMIHQHVMEHEPDVDESSYHGHGPVFAEHCNRIGVLLGLPEVVVRNRGGATKPKAAQWPFCVMPPDRYGGAWQAASCPVTARGDSGRCVPVPPGYLPVAIEPDGTTVLIDFEPESGEITDTVRIRLDVDAAVQLADLLNGFFADEIGGDA